MKATRTQALALASVMTAAAEARADLAPGALVQPVGWTDWSLEPVVTAVLLTMLAAYGAGWSRVWSRAGIGRGLHYHHIAAFVGSISVLVIALLSPLDVAGGLLFSAHMTQHLLLTVVAAPLLILSRPLVALAWATPRFLRRHWRRTSLLRRVLGWLRRPSVALTLHVVAIWIWHAPALYELALESQTIHLLEHFSFWASSVLFWWVVVDNSGSRSVQHGTAILLAFLSAVAGGILGALLVIAPVSLYSGHELGALAYATTSLEDQQLAGLLMWVPGSLAYLAAGLWSFKRWLDAAEARVSDREHAATRLDSVIRTPRTELS